MQTVTGARVLHDRVVQLDFADGTARAIDLSPLLRGPVFEAIRSDDALFAELFVDQDLGTIAWPNGADLDPDVLHGDELPAWMSTTA